MFTSKSQIIFNVYKFDILFLWRVYSTVRSIVFLINYFSTIITYTINLLLSTTVKNNNFLHYFPLHCTVKLIIIRMNCSSTGRLKHMFFKFHLTLFYWLLRKIKIIRNVYYLHDYLFSIQ